MWGRSCGDPCVGTGDSPVQAEPSSAAFDTTSALAISPVHNFLPSLKRVLLLQLLQRRSHLSLKSLRLRHQ